MRLQVLQVWATAVSDHGRSGTVAILARAPHMGAIGTRYFAWGRLTRELARRFRTLLLLNGIRRPIPRVVLDYRRANSIYNRVDPAPASVTQEADRDIEEVD